MTNAQLLSNRISLLKKEEERARKKMLEARTRENKILKIREEQIRLPIEIDLIIEKQCNDHKEKILRQAQEEEVKRHKRIRQREMVWQKNVKTLQVLEKSKKKLKILKNNKGLIIKIKRKR